ncbi:MAG: outer membrane beta-barrel protein [Bacteroidales bacterium]
MRILFFMLVCFLTVNCLSQDVIEPLNAKTHSYYTTDSIVRRGVKIIDQGLKLNSLGCKIMENGKEKLYTPQQVLEYGFGVKTVYVSRKITIDNIQHSVFLERMYKGNSLNLYRLTTENEKIFVVEKDPENNVVIMKSGSETKDFKQTLKDLAVSCPKVIGFIDLLAYNKWDMVEFFKRVDNCSDDPIPHPEFRVVMGFSLLNLVPPKTNLWKFLYEEDLKSIITGSLGISYDYPIAAGSFSFHPELIFSYFRKKTISTFTGDTYKAKLKMGYISIPMLIRYYFPSSNRDYFINTGYVQVINISDNQTYDQFGLTGSSGQTVVLKKSGIIGIKQFIGGLSLGAGRKIILSGGFDLSLEIRGNLYFHRWVSESYDASQIGIHSALSVKWN